MRLAVASGKGGTGKTTLAAALALSAPAPVCLVDCDVEEPNAALFIRPDIHETRAVTVLIPSVDESRCTACGKCGDLCQFNAIVALRTRPLVFPELCHSCGGCARICPENAITEVARPIGDIQKGKKGNLDFLQGRLAVGQAMSPPVIREVKRLAPSEGLVILDCPPGTSCPLVTAIKDCDVALLVTEPTPFGLHDLTLTVDLLRQLRLPFGVIVNRADAGDDRVDKYCLREDIPVLARIPEDRRVAEAYSRGNTLLEARPDMADVLADVLARVRELAAEGIPAGTEGRTA